MAVGDDATAAGYPLVPNTGEEGRVRWGAREINRTRDLLAILSFQVAALSQALAAQPKIATGVMNFPYSGGWTREITIAFPVGKFTTAPVVELTLYCNVTTARARISGQPTTTSMKVTVFTEHQTPLIGNIYCHWVATQT